ncbi:MAG: glycine--tRNA ligase subunit beta [Halioglobus sp.]
MQTDALLIEIGTEEMPPTALRTLGEAFRDGIVAGLGQRELQHSDVRWFATPRRLAVLIHGVQLQAPDRTLEALGPPVDRARDEAGNWTPAALGFARNQGVEPESLQHLTTPKGERLGLRRTEAGLRAKDCLHDIIRDSLRDLPIPRRMRWGASREEFVRPVHWVVVLLGNDCIPGDVLGVPAGRVTRGHRFHCPNDIELTTPEDYEQALQTAYVIASFDKRRDLVRSAVEAQAAAIEATAVIDDALLDEVTGLVEWPVALTGNFEERFLAVPAEALVSSMKAHQKYFHLVDQQGNLRPHFITVANIESSNPAEVIAGNERVIRPRLSDAAFFFETDCKTALANRVAALESIVFQQSLGSLYEKTQRVQRLAGWLAEQIGSPADLAERAALLSKADLVTDMVLEFPDMQGIAGSYYALNDGEPADVASAIAQQYWPRFSGDRLPETLTAQALGLADRLDTLVGIFGIGQPPTGSRDPFALRRASLAVLRIAVERELDLDLAECLAVAADSYSADIVAESTVEEVLAYMLERFRAWYEEAAIPGEVFRAVSSRNLSRPLDIHRRVLAVDAFSRLPEAQALAAANKRVANILAKVDDGHVFGDVSANLLLEPAEKALAAKVEELENSAPALLERENYTQALSELAALRAPVDAFFDGVMVNDEDPGLRGNRLNLLKKLRGLFLEVADISLLVVAR